MGHHRKSDGAGCEPPPNSPVRLFSDGRGGHWQHDDWPNYIIDPGAMESEEIEFAARMESQSLRLAEANPDDQLALQIEWLTDEAVQTSAIEGEMLRRDSVQESLMRRMGLTQGGG